VSAGIRLVATDIDGTTLRTDNTVSQRTRAALRAVEESGRTLVFVTGRPPRWMPMVADAVGHAGLAICSNGALRYDLHTEQIVSTHAIEPDVLREVTKRLRAVIPGVRFGTEYGHRFAYEPGYRHPYDAGTGIEEMDSVVDEPAVKLLARDSELGPDAMLALALPEVGELVTVTHSAGPADGLLEISAHGVTKATELALFAAEQEIGPESVIAFGDMPNDVAMLTWAGRSVAVANAHPLALAAADEVTASNDDDGVAIVLEKLLAAG
jgi:hydroxymethylpyrimidine pyrophosphatase-like HAD family hydrolase